MDVYKLIYGPNPIFKRTSENVEKVDDEILDLCAGLRELLYAQAAVGVAATMVGVLKRVIVVDLQENDKKSPFSMINPVIVSASEEMQSFEEGSICFPGVSAQITRPKSIKVEYLDEGGKKVRMDATGYLSTVIQHEIDYLDGKTYFDYLSPMKRKLLFKKTKKYKNSMHSDKII